MDYQNEADSLSWQIACHLAPECAKAWERDYSNLRGSVTASTLESTLEFLKILDLYLRDLYLAAFLLNVKKQVERGGVGIEKYLNSFQKNDLHSAEKYFYDKLDFLRCQAENAGLAVDCFQWQATEKIIRSEGKRMVLILQDDRVVRGVVNYEADRDHQLYHMIFAEGCHFQLMDVKMVLTEDVFGALTPIYYNQHLENFSPREAYIKKFGEQVEFAFFQEASISDRIRRF